MITTSKKVTTAAATFGAALTSLYAATDLQADVVDLTISGDTPIEFNETASAFATLANAGAGFLFSSISLFNNDDPASGRGIFASSLQFFNFGDVINAAAFTNSADLQTFSANATGLQYLGFSKLAQCRLVFCVNLADDLSFSH